MKLWSGMDHMRRNQGHGGQWPLHFSNWRGAWPLHFFDHSFYKVKDTPVDMLLKVKYEIYLLYIHFYVYVYSEMKTNKLEL